MPGTGELRFGRFQLQRRQRRLLVDGAPVELGSRAIDLLLALIDADGAPLNKDELMSRVWPGIAVEEHNLTVQIHVLRKLLGPDREFIRTVPRHGYAFAGQVEAFDATTEPAPSAAGHRMGTNIPGQVEALIGRDQEVQELIELQGSCRLLTLTGAGGIGKTRLALELAWLRLPSFADGVWLAELATLSDAGLVPGRIATALGLQPGDATDSMQTVAAALAGKNLLLVLDNCEHVIDEAARAAEALLHGTRTVQIIATSREPLRVESESVYRVPALTTPPADANDAAEILRHGAVRLFIARARAADARYRIGDAQLASTATICRRLDGIPLAIELAAARAPELGLDQLLGGLDNSFALLTRGRRTALPRHRTLQATLDWSYDLLRPDQRVVLHRIAAFAGWFTLQDAAAVAENVDFRATDVVQCLADLVDKSFLMIDLGGATAFYRLYEAMREYARQKSADAGELTQTRRRHAEHIARLFTQADAEAEQRDPADWRAAWSRYLDEVRTALDWAMQPDGDAELGISLTADAVTLWSQLSLFRELQQRTEQALDRLGDAAVQGAARAMKLFAGLSTAEVQVYESTPKGTAACRAALEIARRIGNDSYQAKALLALWNGCFATGEVRQSLELAEEFMAVAPRLGRADVLVGHRLFGSSNFYLGDVVTARRHMETMVAGYAATTHGAHMARFSFGQLASGLALLSFYLGFQGHVDQATQMMQQSVDEALRQNHAMTVCGILGTNSIQLSIYLGYLDEARRYLEILYDRARGHGLLRWESFARGYDGILCIRQGQLEEGLRKLSASFAPTEDRSNTRYMLIFCEHALATGLAGNPLGALQAIGEIHDRLVATGIPWYLPEVHRCRARLLEMSGGEPADVEAAYKKALSLAEAMGALTWRLRAARDFATFLDGRGRAREAVNILQGVYNQFAEGQASPMLVATREQLENLEIGCAAKIS